VTGKALGLFKKVIRFTLGRPAPNKGKVRDVFAIAIYEGSSPLDLQPAKNASNPVLTATDVTDLKAIYVADPFIIRVGGLWYMFFEILPSEDEKGVIGVASSRDAMAWRYHQVVLSEPFHLSYPYVFEQDGEFYMIPESHQDKTVRLYKALEFPNRWEHVCNLLEGDEYADCSPFQYRGNWWMFAGHGGPPCHSNVLKLFHAKHLTGPWIEHPASPVISDNHAIARPGGRVVEWEGRLLRFTQDCHPHYGLRLRAFEIHELTLDSYQEKSAADEPILAGTQHGWNAAGMHHIDPHRMDDGSCLASVDGWRWGRV
jgi:hypothetical protein